jgi:hypothetical protein
VVEVSFKEGIKDRENTLTVNPENAFLVSDSLDAFGGSLVIGTPEPTYDKESSSQVSAAATIDGVHPPDYDLFLSWPVNGGANAEVKLSLEEQPLYFWSAEKEGMPHSDFEFAEDVEALSKKLKGAKYSNIKVNLAQILLDQSQVPQDHIFGDFEFDKPPRAAGWRRLASIIKVPAQKHPFEIRVAIQSGQNEQLVLDGLVIAPPSHGWKFARDQHLTWFRREDRDLESNSPNTPTNHVGQ